ncbi:protein UL95 [Saimiriine betaherpesvirus 4]|uniref:Protein UL95 n=1 Tax=Saimiriine betaherpesvirus 4 TaxID=1535247 RepID=G8XSZ9_9BETA|nr:protein UL95 [Saimiriine betaherpesvirus 4]AEV80940.1 protein UL95 [Saimiriine betaherpesvirus 4]
MSSEAGSSGAVSTALCSVERLVELSARSDPVLGVSEVLKFDEAVEMALVACEAASPHDRYRLIETPSENFLLVTNVIPKEMATCSGESEAGEKKAVNQDLLGCLYGEAFSPPVVSSRDYVLKNLRHTANYHGELLYGSYLMYNKEHIGLSLSINKASHVESILRDVFAPGLLEHHNVCDIEALLWLLYSGPRSFCARDACFGREQLGYHMPFPALLPTLFYEPVVDYVTYMNLAELYVYVWYRGYEFASTRDDFRVSLNSVTLDRLQEVLKAVRARFSDREVPCWPVSSRTCVFCALYSQNRLCLDVARNGIGAVFYSPILLQDCPAVVTDVTLSHILPGQGAVTLFPVYHIGKLLDAVRYAENGVARLEL